LTQTIAISKLGNIPGYVTTAHSTSLESRPVTQIPTLSPF